MIYILIFDYTLSQFQPNKIHDMVINHLSVSDWWHYLPNTYIISTTVPTAGISSTVNTFFPGLLHFITKVELDQTSGLLPKEAWEWINKKNENKGKIKIVPRSQVKLRSTLPPISGSKLLDDLIRG